MISSRAVWEGLGVGDSTASSTGAMLIQVSRESMGKLATITFAHILSPSIEAECKKYRFLADMLCDMAMVIDCFSPNLPSISRCSSLCLSSVLFAASGVAGNASKSSLSGHFARWNNLGELNAVSFSAQCLPSAVEISLTDSCSERLQSRDGNISRCYGGKPLLSVALVIAKESPGWKCNTLADSDPNRNLGLVVVLPRCAFALELHGCAISQDAIAQPAPRRHCVFISLAGGSGLDA
jgi:hypothetical protein